MITVNNFKPYSVLLLYPDYMNDDGLETWFDHVENSNPHDAVLTARLNAIKANEMDTADVHDFAVLAVWEGYSELLNVLA